MRLQPLPEGFRVLAPAKINLYLWVGPLRPDGFHDIDSIFQTVSLHDSLDFLPAATGELRLEEEGIQVGEKNLVARAARLLRESPLVAGRGPALPGVRIRLRKGIPEGAGLGGGSSDAAATLVALARHWDLDAKREDLLPLAAHLGSDVPFFLHGGVARCRGRGEVIENWDAAARDVDLPGYILIYPRVKVETAQAYRWLDEARGAATLTASGALDSMPPASVLRALARGELLHNSFEEAVLARVGALERVREGLSRVEGLSGVLLSGSGSTLYGVCPDLAQAEVVSGRVRAMLEGSGQGGEVFCVAGERAHDGLGRFR